MDDGFDGRDELVKKRFKNDSLVAKKESIDDYIGRYTDPWLPAYYSQFDDLKAGKPVVFEDYIDGIIGMRSWKVPVKDIKRPTYDHVSLGWMEIVEVPDFEGGKEFLIRIMEVEDYPDR